MNILHLDSSIQGDASISRRLSRAIVARLRQLERSASVLHRDLALAPIPQFAPGALRNPSERTVQEVADARVLSTVLDEVMAADVIVIGAPMYNFSLPTQLKSWLDAIVVPGRTFRYEQGGVKGFLGDKRVIVGSSRGGFYGPDSPLAEAEHQESLLLSLLGFLGIVDIHVFRAEGMRMGEEAARRGIAAALEQIAHLELPIAA